MKTISKDDPLVAAMLARNRRIEVGYLVHETGYVMTPEQITTMNKALHLVKDGSYRPYCLADGCPDYPRMFLTSEGFTCPSCGNKIGFDLIRL